ncbi:642_t:CDS:2, partial [Acaulospora colombiana]
AKIIADEQGNNLVGASCGFYGPEIIAEYVLNQQNPKYDWNDDEHIESDRFLKKRRSSDDYGSTPPNKGASQRKRYDSNLPPRDEDYFSSESNSEIVPVSLTNVFLETSVELKRIPDQTAESDTLLLLIKPNSV